MFSFCREPQAVHLTGGYTENLSADFPYGTVRRKYKIFFLLPVTPKIRCGEHKKNPAAEKPTGTVSGFCRVSPLYRNILKKKTEMNTLRREKGLAHSPCTRSSDTERRLPEGYDALTGNSVRKDFFRIIFFSGCRYPFSGSHHTLQRRPQSEHLRKVC